MSDASERVEARYFLTREVEVSETEWMEAVRLAGLVRANPTSGRDELNADQFEHITLDGRRVSGRIERP
jgi:hypothetical protein